MSDFFVTISNTDTNEYFFSTKHSQPVPDTFVPVTWYCHSVEEVREAESKMGETEIVNPDYNYIPDFIMVELLTITKEN